MITGATGTATGLDLSDVEGVAVDLTGNAFNDHDFGIAAYSFFGDTMGLDTDPLMSGNTFAEITVLGIYFAPEEWSSIRSATENFTESGSQFADYLAGSLGDDSFDGARRRRHPHRQWRQRRPRRRHRHRHRRL